MDAFINYDVIGETVLRNVISDLYNDPANSYIEICDIAYIARDKIQWKFVDNKLLKARREVQAFYERFQHLLKK
ncbi:hypothetical protein SCALIN_C13_0067 [Candidatus Scalindua japonica]|uniref:Uncharacterized protein n=1 Tax=Candidatus Scalindua japonica TaxID=1284222 RepID=A0A286TXC8_9BACT|nr:hypothetical protein [Candidatus Scalindua japonica]GAX60555.1 hypothetical protein SCALIN_C13_0067 [Candidatus Scalindua japonica]